MDDTITTISKALPFEFPRRIALAGLLAGPAALFPWLGIGKQERRKKRKKRRKKQARFARYLVACREWCGYRFSGKPADECAAKAKWGQGACYSAAERGLGYVCAAELACPAEEECCAAYAPGHTPVTAECCPTYGFCVQYAGPAYVCEIIA